MKKEEIITARERIKREAIASFKVLFPEYDLADLHGTFYVKGYREAAKNYLRKMQRCSS